MKEIEQKIMNKMEELGKNIDGYKLHEDVSKYLQLCKGISEWSHNLAQNTKHIHLGYAPLFNDLFANSGGQDARLWCLIYRDLSIDYMDIPIESYLCMDFSIESATTSSDESVYRIKYNDKQSLYTENGKLKECYYGFMMAGVEEDWWDIDEIAGFERMDAVVEAEQAHAEMKEMKEKMQSTVDGIFDTFDGLFGGTPESIEGWMMGEIGFGGEEE